MSATYEASRMNAFGADAQEASAMDIASAVAAAGPVVESLMRSTSAFDVAILTGQLDPHTDPTSVFLPNVTRSVMQVVCAYEGAGKGETAGTRAGLRSDSRRFVGLVKSAGSPHVVREIYVDEAAAAAAAAGGSGAAIPACRLHLVSSTGLVRDLLAEVSMGLRDVVEVARTAIAAGGALPRVRYAGRLSQSLNRLCAVISLLRSVQAYPKRFRPAHYAKQESDAVLVFCAGEGEITNVYYEAELMLEGTGGFDVSCDTLPLPVSGAWLADQLIPLAQGGRRMQRLLEPQKLLEAALMTRALQRKLAKVGVRAAPDYFVDEDMSLFIKKSLLPLLLGPSIWRCR
jgi:hypothetical protein